MQYTQDIKKANDIIMGDRLTLRRLKPMEIFPLDEVFSLAGKNPAYFRYYAYSWQNVRAVRDHYSKFLQWNLEDKMFTYLMFAKSGFVGEVGTNILSDKRPNRASLEYFVLPHASGKGYVPEGVRLLENELFENLNFKSIISEPCVLNKASIAIMHKLNYKYIAKTKNTWMDFVTQKWLDQLIFSKSCKQWERK